MYRVNYMLRKFKPYINTRKFIPLNNSIRTRINSSSYHSANTRKFTTYRGTCGGGGGGDNTHLVAAAVVGFWIIYSNNNDRYG